MARFLDISGPPGGPEFLDFVGFHQTSILMPVVGLSFSGIIIYTQVMLLNAWVTVLELHHGQISRHFWSACWHRNFGFCRVSSNLDFEASYRPVVFRNHYLHPGDAFERKGNSSGAPSWSYFSTFLVRMVAVFLIDFLCFGVCRV